MDIRQFRQSGAVAGLFGAAVLCLPLIANSAKADEIASYASAARPAGRCSNADLNGSYGFNARGSTLAGTPLPPPLLGAFASAGKALYDGHGNVSLTATSSFNGVIQGPQAVRGTYSVSSDCSFTSKLENGVTFQAVIVADGRELLILQTSPNVVISGSASRQGNSALRWSEFSDSLRPLRCSRESVSRGSYGFIAEGMAGAPTLPLPAAGPLAGVGMVTLHPKGSFSLTATRSVNGTIDPQPLTLTGNYSVTADCSISMQFDVGFNFSGSIVDGGREVRFVETDPGTALLVTAKRM